MNVLEKIKHMPGWKTLTEKALLGGVYDKELKMPCWLDYDVDAEDNEKIKKQIFFYEKNLEYIETVGADYNHLCEYIKTCEDKNLILLASGVIKKYAEFITTNLESKNKKPFRNGEFNHSNAAQIYFQQHLDFFTRISETNKKSKKKINISKF